MSARCIGINPDRSYPTIELEFPSYKYQIATLSPRNGLAMQAQTKNEQLLRSCAFQDDVRDRLGASADVATCLMILARARREPNDAFGFLRLAPVE